MVRSLNVSNHTVSVADVTITNACKTITLCLPGTTEEVEGRVSWHLVYISTLAMTNKPGVDALIDSYHFMYSTPNCSKGSAANSDRTFYVYTNVCPVLRLSFVSSSLAVSRSFLSSRRAEVDFLVYHTSRVGRFLDFSKSYSLRKVTH